MSSYVIPAEGKILACLDASQYGASVTDHALWAAQRLDAPLSFLHVLDRQPELAPVADYSGNIGMDSSAELLKELAGVDERRARLGAERGRLLIEQARQKASAAGPTRVDGLQRHGSLVETLTEAEEGVRLIVIGKRGEAADFAKGHLGGNLERVVRAVHRPVLVASRAFRPVNRFLIAFDGSPTTRKAVEMVAASPLFRGLECHVVMAGGEGVDARNQLDWAQAILQGAGFAVAAALVDGEPEAVIARQVQDQGIDLLVMGAYGHSRIRQLIVGSTTTTLMRTCPVPVLLLR